MLKVSRVHNSYMVSFVNLKKFNIIVAQELLEQLEVLVKQKGAVLNLNMEGIVFIDSAGFEALLKLHRTAVANEASVRLLNLSDEAQEVIELVELDKVVEIA